MIPKVVFSDVHANLEALARALVHIDITTADWPAREIYVLGDIIGYGPDPLECIDLIRGRGAQCLIGNHELFVQSDDDDAYGFTPEAAECGIWTRSQLMEPGNGSKRRFIDGLPVRIDTPDALYAHGCPIPGCEAFDYLYTPETIGRFPLSHAQEANHALILLDEAIQYMKTTNKRLVFLGHTHIPAFMKIDGNRIFSVQGRFACSFGLNLEKFMYIINVGSIGQSRDGTSLPCYVTFKDGTVSFHRLTYNVDKTCERIKAAGLDPELADRLRFGC